MNSENSPERSLPDSGGARPDPPTDSNLSSPPPLPISVGVEVLMMKAAVDPEFKEVFLNEREAAASRINLPLTLAEALMLKTAGRMDLELLIAAVRVPEKARGVFLGYSGPAMQAVLRDRESSPIPYPEPSPLPPPGGMRPDLPFSHGRRSWTESPLLWIKLALLLGVLALIFLWVHHFWK